MTNDELYRYFRGDASENEIADIERWLQADPANKLRFNEAQAMFAAMVMSAPAESLRDSFVVKRKTGRVVRLAMRISAAAAAVALVVSASVYMTRHAVENRLAETMTTISAPAGQRVNITLQDGTTVWLNSGTTIEYPARFGKERKVNVEGEALFDVARDERHPFIVRTHACDVKVLGTKFNVLSDKESDMFCTSLLRGKVQVTNNRTGQSIILAPEQSVELKDGKLVRSSLESHDGLMWNEGIISLYGDTFGALMRRFENAFGVRIDVIGSADIPMRTRGKVRVSEGIAHALDILGNYIDFRYDYDIDANVVTITLK